MAIENITNDHQSDAIRLMKQRLSKFETVEGRLHGLAYKPKANDVVISTTPKAGTTWMQQICHQIRCASISPESCMDFEEIGGVVPWIELAKDLCQNLNADQPPFNRDEHLPRFFKTHCWYNHCPCFPKTIVVIRDPYDVLISFYNFFDGWFFESGSIDIDTFADEFWLSRGIPDDSKMQNASYFFHLVSWYENRHGDDSSKVLFVFFEDLLENLECQVSRIAKFLSNEHHNFDTDEVLRHTVSHSTFSFMRRNEKHFDEKLTKLARNEICGLPKDAGMTKSKIAVGKSGVGRATLSDSIRCKIQAKWDEVVFPVTGCSNYSELRVHMRDFNTDNQ
jgi:Sulfotransferase domain